MGVLVTGASGLLGREVTRVLREQGTDVHPLGHSELDVANESMVREVIGRLRPTAVVHCAAMTNVDACEAQADLAWAVNASGSGHVASAAADVGAEIVAVSTDYVFDGTREFYVESDEPNPVQEYGRSKLGGEQAVAAANERHYVVRSAWIYGVGGKNFLSQLPRLAAAGAPITAVVDQRGSPTYAPDLADAIAALLGTEKYGILHAVNDGACTFAEFCRHAFAVAGASVEVADVSWRDLGLAATRPESTALVGEAWMKSGFAPLRPWTEAARTFLAGRAQA